MPDKDSSIVKVTKPKPLKLDKRTFKRLFKGYGKHLNEKVS
jgi:hypothetical protein